MNFPLLDNIQIPANLREHTIGELPEICSELREYLIQTVSQSGGHLASGLGVIELTVALHYVFNTPDDRLVWDVGHQCYPHKILTGRKEQMGSIRKDKGLAGFPKRCESEYDTFGVGHSSTSISAALGMAIAAEKTGSSRQSVAIIGDGAMTAGMAFEALNHASDTGSNLLVILNDNEMSISPNVGGLSNYLTKILSGKVYNQVRHNGKKVLNLLPPIEEFARRAEDHLKGMVTPGTLFEELGFEYYGPIDGHDSIELAKTLQNLKSIDKPKLLHIVTKKGKGYALAEAEPILYHGVGQFDPKIGLTKKKPSKPVKSYSQIFGDWLCDQAAADERLVGITPAMREGSGMVEFSEKFPDRYFDVGIAEQHSVTLAAGMACDGLKPVVAIYSTFLQRAYDQMIHDVALQNLPVLFGIDRAGIVGADGPTHSGSFDIAYMRCLPNIVIMTPSDENECRLMLNTGFAHDGPAAVRYPRGTGPGNLPSQHFDTIEIGKARVIKEGSTLAILVFGTMLNDVVSIAEKLDATLIDMRFVKPLDTDKITELVNTHTHLVTIEEGCRAGGAGSAINEYILNNLEKCPKLLNIGLDDEFPEHGSREFVLSVAGIDPSSIEQKIHDFITP